MYYHFSFTAQVDGKIMLLGISTQNDGMVVELSQIDTSLYMYLIFECSYRIDIGPAYVYPKNTICENPCRGSCGIFGFSCGVSCGIPRVSRRSSCGTFVGKILSLRGVGQKKNLEIRHAT